MAEIWSTWKTVSWNNGFRQYLRWKGSSFLFNVYIYF